MTLEFTIPLMPIWYKSAQVKVVPNEEDLDIARPEVTEPESSDPRFDEMTVSLRVLAASKREASTRLP